MMVFLNQLINGLSLGAIYALVAIGYTMVYGIVKLINFAHSDVVMAGAYISFTCMSVGMNPILSCIIAMIFCTVLGILMERFTYKPLRHCSTITLLIVSIGMSYIIQSAFRLIYSSTPKTYPSFINIPSIDYNGLYISGITIVVFIVSVFLMIVLTFLVSKTKSGKAMRAVSQDIGAAELTGINVNATISWTFAIGSFLAAVAGILYASAYPVITPYMSTSFGTKAFASAVIGGIGSIPGAMLGGFLIGLLESFSKAYLSSQLSKSVVFLLLVIMLLVRPAGILGKSLKEKV